MTEEQCYPTLHMSHVCSEPAITQFPRPSFLHQIFSQYILVFISVHLNCTTYHSILINPYHPFFQCDVLRMILTCFPLTKNNFQALTFVL